MKSVEELKRDVLPALFADSSRVAEYGDGASGKEALQALSDLMERGAVSRLAAAIEAIVNKLSDADPKQIAKAPNWLDKLLGRHVERRVRYDVARKSLDELIQAAAGIEQSVRDTLRMVDQTLSTHEVETARLDDLIRAGQEYLDENPQAGMAAAGQLEFDKPRERFARKLANLATLRASHAMSFMQMKLTRAQAVDMLDRFAETKSVLVPVWRQHTLALITSKHMDPAMVGEAAKAHTALMRSLSKSLEGVK